MLYIEPDHGMEAMYTLKVITVRKGREWAVLPNLQVTISSLLEEYSDVILDTIIDDAVIYTQFVLQDLLNIRSVASGVLVDTYIDTFDGILTPVVLDDDVRSLNQVKRVTYSSIWDNGFRADRGYYVVTPSASDPLYFLPDIKISKLPVQVNTMSELDQNFVYMVNGRVYWHITKDEEVYLIGAMAALDRGYNKHISLLDFSRLGGYTRVVLGIGSVTLKSKTDYQSVVTIDVGQDMTGLTPLLVVDGRIWFLNGGYKAKDSNRLVATIVHDQVVARADQRDAVELGWVDPLTLDGVGYDLATVDVVKLMENGTSGVILVPTNALCKYTERLGRTGIPGRYTHYRNPNGILLLSDGTIGDYDVTDSSSFEIVLSVTEPHTLGRISDTDVNGLYTDNQRDLDIIASAPATMLDLYTL